MFIGKINNIGGRDGSGNFGFITPLGGIDNRGVFFRFSDISVNSSLQKSINNGTWWNQMVVYEINELDNNEFHDRAKNVSLLAEIDGKTIIDSIDKKQEKRKDVDSFLYKNFPEDYFGTDVQKYLSKFDEKTVRELFYQKYADNCFGKVFCLNYIECAKGNSYLYWGEDVSEGVDLSGEKHEDIVELALCLARKSKNVLGLLRRYPFLVENDTVLASLRLDQIKQLIHGKEQSDQDDILIKLSSVTKDHSVLRFIATSCSDEEFVYHSKKLLACFSDDEIKAIIERIDWRDTSSKNIDHNKLLLNMIEADDYPKAAVAIASSTLEQNVIMSELWWAYLTESVKIRIIIYLSSFMGKQDLLPHFKRIYNYETEKRNELLEAVLLFVSVYYAKTDEKKQKLFQKAHEKLEEYIVSSFNTQKFISKGLDTLMDKCKACSPTSRVYYCDAKPWQKEDGFYCSEGLGHFSARRKCSQYDHFDYKDTLFQKTKDYGDQHLQELILNIEFIPDIRWIKNTKNYTREDGYEYAFLVAGYLNRLIDMEPHMKCKCGTHFIADYQYTKKITPKISRTRFKCPQSNNTDESQHDPEVYLNYCIRCQRVIDSRECKIQDESGYWLCMYCGGSNLYGGKDGPLKCPNCGTTEKEALKMSGTSRIRCEKCGHNRTSEDEWRLFTTENDVKKILPASNVHQNDEMGFSAIDTSELPF